MRRMTRCGIATVMAVAIMACVIGSASARSLSVTNRNFRVTWTPLTYSEPFAFFSVRCNVTVEGSLHENTISKVIGSLVGYVTRAAVAHPCTGGEGWAWNGTEGALTGASTLPWHITYQGFTGTLPNIASVRLSMRGFKFSINTGVCLGTYAPAVISGTANISASRTMTLTPGTELFRAIEGSCPEGRYSGTSGTLVLLGTTTAISISLI